jgi:hypothetical protein
MGFKRPIYQGVSQSYEITSRRRLILFCGEQFLRLIVATSKKRDETKEIVAADLDFSRFARE